MLDVLRQRKPAAEQNRIEKKRRFGDAERELIAAIRECEELDKEEERILRKLNVSEQEPSSTLQYVDVSGETIPGACFKILKASGGGEEFFRPIDIYKMAVEFGYEHDSDLTADRIAQSFFSSMRQRQDVFEWKSPSQFRLIEAVRGLESLPPRTKTPKRKTTDTPLRIREFLAKNGPSRPVDIIRELQLGDATIRRWLRKDHFKQVVRGLWDLLDDDPLRNHETNGKETHEK